MQEEIATTVLRLRANVLVDRIVLRTLIESLDDEGFSAAAGLIRLRLEQFTVRTLNSPMPEPFAEAQRDDAAIWLREIERLQASRAGHPESPPT